MPIVLDLINYIPEKVEIKIELPRMCQLRILGEFTLIVSQQLSKKSSPGVGKGEGGQKL